MRKATEATVDFAATGKIDLETAAQLIGKSFLGVTNTLRRYGIVISESLSTSEKFGAVLDFIGTRFGGLAAKEAESYIGRMIRLRNAFNDIREAIARVVTPALSEVAEDFEEGALKVAEFIDSTRPESADAVIQFYRDLKFEIGEIGRLVESIDESKLGFLIDPTRGVRAIDAASSALGRAFGAPASVETTDRFDPDLAARLSASRRANPFGVALSQIQDRLLAGIEATEEERALIAAGLIGESLNRSLEFTRQNRGPNTLAERIRQGNLLEAEAEDDERALRIQQRRNNLLDQQFETERRIIGLRAQVGAVSEEAALGREFALREQSLSRESEIIQAQIDLTQKRIDAELLKTGLLDENLVTQRESFELAQRLLARDREALGQELEIRRQILGVERDRAELAARRNVAEDQARFAEVTRSLRLETFRITQRQAVIEEETNNRAVLDARRAFLQESLSLANSIDRLGIQRQIADVDKEIELSRIRESAETERITEQLREQARLSERRLDSQRTGRELNLRNQQLGILQQGRNLRPIFGGGELLEAEFDLRRQIAQLEQDRLVQARIGAEEELRIAAERNQRLIDAGAATDELTAASIRLAEARDAFDAAGEAEAFGELVLKTRLVNLELEQTKTKFEELNEDVNEVAGLVGNIGGAFRGLNTEFDEGLRLVDQTISRFNSLVSIVENLIALQETLNLLKAVGAVIGFAGGGAGAAAGAAAAGGVATSGADLAAGPSTVTQFGGAGASRGLPGGSTKSGAAMIVFADPGGIGKASANSREGDRAIRGIVSTTER